MKRCQWFIKLLVSCLLLTSTACAPVVAADTPVPSTTATSLPPTLAPTLSQEPSPPPTIAPISETLDDGLIVAYVENGELKRWHEATNQTESIFDHGAVSTLIMSDDGQVIAFTRRWFDFAQCEQTALWAIDGDGKNPREIVGPEELRATLGDTDCEYPSIVFAQIQWLPGTHRLVYSVIWDAPHAPPQGIYLADADALSTTQLIPTDYNLRFVASPDGSQIALLSASGLGFLSADGWRQDVLTYPKTGIPLPGFATGVWTLDSRAFILVAPSESGVEILRVPVDGSAVQQLAALPDTHVDSVTLSPDGQHAAYSQASAWVITPLPANVGPLAIPRRIILDSPANLHWSPGGAAFVFPDESTGSLFQLCPNATQGAQICGEPVIQANDYVDVIQWLDGDQFLYLTREPRRLFLGRLDGTSVPIVTWPLEEWVTPESFSAVLLKPPR